MTKHRILRARQVRHCTNEAPHNQENARHKMILLRAALCGCLTLGTAGLFTPAVSAAPVKPRPHRPDMRNVGTRPVGFIRDRVITRRRGVAHAASLIIPDNASRDTYTANGMNIDVAVSPSYTTNDSTNQAWAQFFADLPQSSDADGMTVYIAPPDEVKEQCGSTSVACYWHGDKTMAIPGVDPTDSGGEPLEEVAMHEFGHLIADQRSNDPWPAIDFGPKRWANWLRVCGNTRSKALFPGNEGDNYSLNPGEGWAETYRVASGGSKSLWAIVDNYFKPDSKTSNLALTDVTNPWRGNTRRTYRGSFSKRGSRTKTIRLPATVDGVVRVRLTSSRGLDVDIQILNRNGRSRLGHSERYGTKESIDTTACDAGGSVLLRLYRYSGTGTYNITTTLPLG